MKIINPLIMICLLASCQSNNRKKIDYSAFINDQELTQKHRVQSFRFQGWQPLDERYLILRSNQRNSYLIQLMSSCNELPFAQSISLKQGLSSSLVAKFDSIVVPGSFQQECTIHSIYLMDKLQKQALLDLSDNDDQIRGEWTDLNQLRGFVFTGPDNGMNILIIMVYGIRLTFVFFEL